MSDPIDPMAEIRASFFVECEELLEALQDGLQVMEDGESDDETVNVVFRAVHSIKGGAGAFGLDNLVGFAHKFETAMDDVRSGKLNVDTDLLKLFFLCGDVLADLVHECRDEQEHDPSRLEPVVKQLADLIGDKEEAEEDIYFQPAALSMDLDLDLGVGGMLGEMAGSEAADPMFDIRFKPKSDLFSSGNEPLYLFRAARDLGAITVDCLARDLPDLEDLDPETCYLSWHLSLATGEGEEVIREIFDFVEDLCELNITEQAASTLPVFPELPEAISVTPEDHTIPDLPALPDLVEPAATADLSNTSASVSPAIDAADPQKKAGKPKTITAPKATVRVDIERIDRLVNLVGEIVINQAMLTQSVEEAGVLSDASVRAGLEEFLQLTRDIQESVMMIRAQPVKSLFQRMARIVREASSDIGKNVRLQAEGENTEIDKTVIERLSDPLTHMIRNAVDHGLEPNEERVASGKEAQGVVSLTAMHRSGRVVIEVADDGAGIDRTKVRQIAINKGLIDEGLILSDSEIDNLLFLPGFSTADKVSNLSGRGVGMDVVRSAIQSLGGHVTITSERGTGTTFSISLPLTLAVLDGMVIRVANETLVVPLNAIMETMALTDEEIRAFGPETHVVNIRDTFIPLLDLGAELGYREPLDDYSRSVILLVAHEDGTRAAVIVDSIEDQRQVVIKGLQDSYGHVPGIAAATILGDGQIALILDPIGLIAKASGRTRPSQQVELQAG